jgi:hypothetical protein
MSTDPWSRPSIDDLKRILEQFEHEAQDTNVRTAERIELTVPAEIVTSRGNTVSAMTREISRLGIGLMHRGSLTPGDVRVKLASDTREFEYNVRLEWCLPADNGMFLSGGRFLGKASA